jgi:hypothetical protein
MHNVDSISFLWEEKFEDTNVDSISFLWEEKFEDTNVDSISFLWEEKFDDTKGVNRSYKLKDRQHNGQKNQRTCVSFTSFI